MNGMMTEYDCSYAVEFTPINELLGYELHLDTQVLLNNAMLKESKKSKCHVKQ